MEEKIQCNGFTIEILTTQVSYDDGSSWCPTCWYSDEYEIETSIIVQSETGEIITYCINEYNTSGINEYNTSGAFVSVAELTSFIINLIVNQTSYQEFKTLIEEEFENRIKGEI